VIQDNLDYFQKRELDLVSDLEKIQILEKIVKNLSPSHPLYKRPG
jgi:DNA helicase-2/ATP-dependent DNA helicase PcrA